MPAENRITLAGNFVSNSFTKDQFTLGLEYAFKNVVMLRAGYTYEQGIWDDINTSERTNVSSGLSAGHHQTNNILRQATKKCNYDLHIRS